MKYTILSILVGSLLLAGCGGSDNNSNSSPKDNGGQGTPSTPKETVNWNDQETVNGLVGSAVSVLIPMGFTDGLITGTDDAFDNDNVQCKSGTITKTANKITFNDCKGLFGDDVTVSGTVNKTTTGNKYTYQYDKLIIDDGEKSTINGIVTAEGDDFNSTVTINNFKVSSIEIDEKKQKRTVEYLLNNYKFESKDMGNDAFSIKMSGESSSTGSEVGDYGIKFNTEQPFLFKNEDSNAYNGLLKVSSMSNPQNYATVSANADETNVIYQSFSNNKLFINKTITWDELLDY
ncbi:hypothetical protein QSV37_04470 [Acinetobacter sp. VNK23]|uniref:hypothetical protein n=1 Tax=Acinetobacter thutiue TaxID=2998078 RepID=UPI002574FF06|nr:hypothetical protein [Acinetobacter thutiue]MDM1019566.1 hypothetical protein [Acinetobacter thutiue]